VRRRHFLLSLPGLLAAQGLHAAKVTYPQVKPGYRLQFPRDHGAHPEYRVEWWYLTGWLDVPYGFQITFFRARPEEKRAVPHADDTDNGNDGGGRPLDGAAQGA